MQSHEDESQEERATGCTDAEGLLPWFTWIHLEYFEVTDACVYLIQTEQCSDWLYAQRQVAVPSSLLLKTTGHGLCGYVSALK